MVPIRSHGDDNVFMTADFGEACQAKPGSFSVTGFPPRIPPLRQRQVLPAGQKGTAKFQSAFRAVGGGWSEYRAKIVFQHGVQRSAMSDAVEYMPHWSIPQAFVKWVSSSCSALAQLFICSTKSASLPLTNSARASAASAPESSSP